LLLFEIACCNYSKCCVLSLAYFPFVDIIKFIFYFVVMKYPIVHAERDLRFHLGLKNLLTQNDEFQFSDHCCYLDAALQSLDQYKPKVLITGYHLYDERYVIKTFCEYRKACLPGLKIIVLTRHNDLDYMLDALISGVDGYLTKDAGDEEMLNCISSVARGRTHLSIGQQVSDRNSGYHL
jgi:DNA-binding NarL/FixJ family response regulator